MSNTASLENCKRLYELSGWDDTRDYYHSLISHDTKRWSEYKLQDYKPDNDFGMRVVPAYDAGYLLRKLPTNSAEAENNAQFRMTVEYTPRGWKAFYHFGKPMMHEYADTPEDALCLLAIKLFEEGILK